MAIYLKFSNTKGIPSAEGHTGQIAVLLKSFAVHISREVSMDGDQVQAGEWAGTATFTKVADRTISALLKETLAGGQTLSVTIVATRGRAQEILSYKFSNCVLNAYDEDPDDPIETFELNFSVTEDFVQHSSHRQARQSAQCAV